MVSRQKKNFESSASPASCSTKCLVQSERGARGGGGGATDHEIVGRRAEAREEGRRRTGRGRRQGVRATAGRRHDLGTG
jgi:hypothetical protein